jgi:hypothetical protein
MCDVIHVYFEEDVIPRFENEIEAKDAVRAQLYQLLYEQEYRYGRKTGNATSPGTPPMPTVTDLPPEAQPIKPFFPATDPEEFASVLDAPMGA